MLAKIKELKKKEDEANAAAGGLPSATRVSSTKVIPLKGSAAKLVTKKPVATKTKLSNDQKLRKKPKGEVSSKKRSRRKRGVLRNCIRGWKKYCKKHGKGYAITSFQLLLFFSTLLAVYFLLSSRSGCNVADTVVEATKDGIGEGYLRCLGSYGGYFICKDGETNWKCIRRYDLCVPKAWSVGFFTDPDCVRFDTKVSPARLNTSRTPHSYKSNFSRSDGTFVSLEHAMYFPQLGDLDGAAFPTIVTDGLSRNPAGQPMEIPLSYTQHDYFYGSYTFALVVGSNSQYQFFTIPLMKCQEITYKLDDETEYKNFVYVDSWCEEGEVQEESHQRSEPPQELYIEIPRNTGVGL